MTSTRTPRLLGQKQNKFLLTVCLCALTAALIFLPFSTSSTADFSTTRGTSTASRSAFTAI